MAMGMTGFFSPSVCSPNQNLIFFSSTTTRRLRLRLRAFPEENCGGRRRLGSACLCPISRGLLRHGVSIWIGVPIELAVNDMLKTMGTQATSDPDSFSQATGKLIRQRYDELKERYAVPDVTFSVQNVASQLGYGSIDSLNLEDMVLEIVRQIERLIRAKSMMEAGWKALLD